MPSAADYFSPDYTTARDRFREAARRAGAHLDTLTLTARGPNGGALSIDIARLGAQTPQRVLLHTSGLHGVEGFAGSAVQLRSLEFPPDVPQDSALVLVHALNPYGLAWLRRANENNVDLNRNFIADGEGWTGAPPHYRAIDTLINPPGPPRRDFFYARAIARVLRHGFAPLKQAVAEGQYEFPRGLFFGGKALEEGPRLYLDWLRTALAGVRYVFALDLHTGLGKRCRESLIQETGASTTAAAILSTALGHEVTDPAHASEVAYRIRGGLGSALPRCFPGARIDFVLQELGTYSALRVLRALRDENRCHHYGDARPDHPAKRRLLEQLTPRSPEWRIWAVRTGTERLTAAAHSAFSKPCEAS
jgi:hypothetical protein